MFRHRIKESVKKEYSGRLRMILKSDWNAKNEVTAFGALAVPVLTFWRRIIFQILAHPVFKM